MLSKRTWVAATTLVSGALAGYSLFKHFTPPPTFQQKLQEYINSIYQTLILKEEEVEQLSWMQGDDVTILANDVKITLARLHCLQLLLQNNTQAYLQFVSEQPKFALMREDQFQALSNFIKNLHPVVLEALRAACFMTKTQHATEMALFAKIAVDGDEQKFIATTLEQCPDIYPVWEKQIRAVRELIPFAFLRENNFRQIFNTEGGYQMLATLRTGIQSGAITQKEYDLWISFSILDLATSNALDEPLGSTFLIENVTTSFFMLKQELDNILKHPEHDVLSAYLKKRAESLGLKNEFLAHVACLMGIFESNQAKELANWFTSLGYFKCRELNNRYEQFKQLPFTPLHQTHLINSLRSATGSIAETAAIFTELLNKVVDAYVANQANQSGSRPLSLEQLADYTFLQKDVIPAYRAKGTLNLAFNFDDKGTLRAEMLPTTPIYRRL